MRIVQFFETYKENRLVPILHELIYLRREAIPVEIDLPISKPKEESLTKYNMELINISWENFEKLQLKYHFKNRYLKALHYLSIGYEAFAIVKGNEVLGDVWYVSSTNSKQKLTHPDFKLFGIDLGENEVYTFDMYVIPERRGDFLAVSLLSGSLQELGEKGFLKAYGYFMADNIPALWLHRILKFNESKKLKMQRLLFIRRSKMVN